MVFSQSWLLNPCYNVHLESFHCCCEKDSLIHTYQGALHTLSLLLSIQELSSTFPLQSELPSFFAIPRPSPAITVVLARSPPGLARGRRSNVLIITASAPTPTVPASLVIHASATACLVSLFTLYVSILLCLVLHRFKYFRLPIYGDFAEIAFALRPCRSHT